MIENNKNIVKQKNDFIFLDKPSKNIWFAIGNKEHFLRRSKYGYA